MRSARECVRSALLGVTLLAVLVCGGLWRVTAMAAAPVVPPVATDEPPDVRNLRIVPPTLPSASSAQEVANKRIVLQWHYEFFDLGHFKEAADKYLAADFQQNDPDEKSGSAAYVQEFEHNGYVPRPAAERPPLIAVLAQGDLVMVVIPAGWAAAPGKNPENGFVHCNMFRLKNGRITSMWVSADAARPPTPSK